LRELIIKEQITTLHFVPSMLRVFLAEEGLEQCATLKRVISSGEELSAEVAADFFSRLGWAELHNLYGPTEAAVDVTWWECQREWEGRVPIGKPIWNTQVYVLDRAQRPVPLGVLGELYLGGVQVGRGYWQRAELTAEKFVPDPYGGERGARLYRTGDVVRQVGAGVLEYVGRADYQVKVRGYRIELGEVEAALREQEGVRECVVVARQEEGGSDKRLVAYVVDGTSPAGLDTVELRRMLKRRLPEHMVPSLFVLLQELPLTANGKIDRRALPEPNGMKTSTESGYIAPRTPVEEMLAGIWSTVLGISQVSINDAFFDLGGHSLLATQVISRVRSAFNIEIPLPVFFKEPTIAGLAANVEAALQDKSESQIPTIRPVPRSDELPLSFSQQRLWFLDQWEPASPFYNSPSVLRLSGRLELAVLQRTLFEVVRRHEVLRTYFPSVAGQPRQRIVERWQPALPLIDLSGLDQALAQEATKWLVQREALQPFDLATGPLLRATLLRLGAEEHVLLFTMHHIVSDGWSMGLLVREVAALYKAYQSGEESPLEELAVQYADYAVWQREWLAGEVLEEQLEYWRRQLAGAPAVLELPADRPRPRVQSYRGATSEFRLSAELTAGLKELSRRSGVTLFMTLLAGFEVLLWRLSGQEDICVGTAIANRTRRETEGLIGFFVNTLVLRVGVNGELSSRELLGRVREICLGAYGHQEVPFEKLVEELQPERSLSHTPLFQVAFGLDNAPREALQLPGLKLSGMELEDEVVRFDLTLWMREDGAELSGQWTYRSELFDAQRVERMSRHYERLLQSMVANPEAHIETLEMFTQAEKEQEAIDLMLKEELVSEKILMTTRKPIKLAESVT
jgi:acyl carrier protein